MHCDPVLMKGCHDFITGDIVNSNYFDEMVFERLKLQYGWVMLGAIVLQLIPIFSIRFKV